MTFKRYFFILFFAPFISFCGIAFYIVYDDTLQIFPKGYFIKEKFVTEMREQNKGIIDNVDFNSVLLGTSMLKCSSALEASQLLHGKFVNLSVSAGTFYERQFILAYLFQEKKVKNILYSFDFIYPDTLIRQTRSLPWTILYDNNPYNDVAIYYDARFVLDFFSKMCTFKKNTHASIDFFDHPIDWFDDKDDMKSFGGLENWIRGIKSNILHTVLIQALPETVASLPKDLPSTEVNKKLLYNSLEEIENNIITFVKAHPETKFHIIIPPYSRYRYAVMRQVSGSDYGLHQERIRYIVDASVKYSNLIVYGFEDMPFLDDIANYKDTLHYHHSINSMMNHAIADGTHILTPENLEPYLATCDALAQTFDIKKLYDDACVLMLKHGLDPKTGKKVH